MLQYININTSRGCYFVRQYFHNEQMGRTFPCISDFYKTYSTRKFAASLNCKQHCDNLNNTDVFSYVGGAIWGNKFSFSYCTCWKYADEYFYICECAHNDYLICSPELEGMRANINFIYFFGNQYTTQKIERNNIIKSYTINTIDNNTGRPVRCCVLDDDIIEILNSPAYLSNWVQYHQRYNEAMLDNALKCFNMHIRDISLNEYERVKECNNYADLLDAIDAVIANIEISLEQQIEAERNNWSLYLDAVL